MGAWGHQTFQNDSALDWIHEVVASRTTVLATLERVADAEADAYVDADDASAALAAAELVAAAHDRGDDRIPKKVAASLAPLRDDARAVPTACAMRAVRRVLASSELASLWADSEDWRADVRELLLRLSD